MTKSGRSWSVYIVQCADGTLYTGSSPDVGGRVQAHNAGQGAKYTKTRRPVSLVYQELCADQSSALKREYAIKQLTRQEKLALCQNKEYP